MRYFLIITLGLLSTLAQAQQYSITGTVISGEDNNPLPAATVILQDDSDSSRVAGVVTDFNGNFIIDNIKPGHYLMQVKFIGYQPLQTQVTVPRDQSGPMDLGNMVLREETTTLAEVVIEGKSPTGEQKGDTTSFNANAFTTLPDASGQDLLEKMPGIQMQDGNLQAQGENIVKILVDGKPFFGNDVKAALQNLPAEVIQRIEVFDQKSDKALLSGFDDGEREKTINIITKPNRRKGQFGRASAGYGTDDRYLLGASVNMFNEDQRITITGLSNNINAVDYSADPNSQGEMRTQNGIIATNTLGINFSDDFKDKLELSGSYLFSNRENIGNSSRIREYVLASDSGQVYTENSFNTQENMDHRFNMRLEYNMDENNRMIIRPNVSLRSYKISENFEGETVTDDGLLNQTENTAFTENTDYDFATSAYYSHKFPKEGRTITTGGEIGYHTNEDRGTREAYNVYYSNGEDIEILNQQIIRDRTGLSWEAEVSYTEPIGKRSQVELEYEIGDRINDSDRRLYNVYEDDPQGTYIVMDTALSNTFKSQYLTQEAELGYQYSTEKMRFQIEGEYQNAKLKNDQQFPQPFNMDRVFQSFLPTVRFDYEFSKTKNLEFDYDTWTNEPSIGQLQNVIDNSNPLHLRTGNPDLDQAFSHRLRLRYRNRNMEKERSLFLYMAASIIQDRIANSSMIAQEPVQLADDIILERGSQLTRPVNVDGYWDFRSYLSYWIPFEFIQSNIGFNASLNYSQNPGIINDQTNFVNSVRYRLGISLSSDISENIDFNFSSRGAYYVVRNSLRTSLDNDYYNQSTRFSFDWIFWKGFIYRLDMNHQLNTGLAEAYDRSYTLVNMSIGKKFLKNERAELSLNVYDLLAQNNNIRRNVTELYIEDVQSNVLQRYFMLTFSYNLRRFSQGTTMEDYKNLHE